MYRSREGFSFFLANSHNREKAKASTFEEMLFPSS
jgi:hypothetical protein